jgi:hypothetical protein
MVEALVALIQSAAVLFVAWGAYLCLFCRDRRVGKRTSSLDRRGAAQPANVIDLSAAAKDRATDFEIGFRRPRSMEKLAA